MRRVVKLRVLYALAALVLTVAVGLPVTIYLATMEVVGRFAETLQGGPLDYGLPAEVVRFQSLDGINLKGWWIPASGPTGTAARGTVVVAHGSGDNRSAMLSRSKFLAANGYNAFPIDLRAHGESDGRFMTPGYLEALDILGAVDEAKRHGAQGPFIVFGHSYGAVAALWAAARSPEIAAVVADGAFLTPEDVTVHGAQIVIRDPNSSFWEKFGMRLIARLVESPASLRFAYWAMYVRTGVHVTQGVANSLRAIAQMGPRPVLFIAGEKDGIALPEGASKMYDAAASAKKGLWIVPGAGHNSTYRYKDKASAQIYEDHVLKFLTSVLPGEGCAPCAQENP